MKSITSVLLLITIALFSCGEPKFTKLKSGIEYKILKKGKGKKAEVGSLITVHMRTLLNDSVLYDSRTMGNMEPVRTEVAKPMFNGDMNEALTYLKEGDSALVKIPADSAFGGNSLPEFIKKGDYLNFVVTLIKVQTKEEFEADQARKATEQNATDDKLIQEYLQKNNLQAEKTASGIYYIIEKTGNGKKPTAQDTVKVNYRGTLLSGEEFDSSFKRNEPATFGLTMVIPGWTQGIPMFEEGGKGKLIIPSSLAYGQNPPPGSVIKPNSVLMFEIELLKIIPPKAQ